MRPLSRYRVLLVVLSSVFWTVDLLALNGIRVPFLPFNAVVNALVWHWGLVVLFSALLMGVMFRLVWVPWQRAADTDALTGLLRPESFWQAAAERHRLAARYRDALTFVYLDMNAFKQLNDTAGHGAGDAALHTFGSALLQHTRSTDIVGRLGGDEFGLVLWRTSRAEVDQAISRIRELCGATAFHPAFTFSVGVATVADAGVYTLQELAREADQKLYAAKAVAHANDSTAACTPDASSAAAR